MTFRARAMGDDPIEDPGKRGRIIFDPKEYSRWSRDCCSTNAGEVELETRINGRAQRIVLLGQYVEDDELSRLPLLSSSKNRKRASLPGDSYRKSAACIECPRRPVPHADKEHVVHRAGDWRQRL